MSLPQLQQQYNLITQAIMQYQNEERALWNQIVTTEDPSFSKNMDSYNRQKMVLQLQNDREQIMGYITDQYNKNTAQQASGLSCWARDTEHVEKAFDFGGMPARNGVTAATMVASKFTGVEDVFYGDRGFFHAHEKYAEPEKFVAGLGLDFDIMQTAIKRWPVGYPIQAPLDALSNLMAKHGVRAADVASLKITLDEQGARTVSGRTMADINIQHLAALMLIDGDITFETSHSSKRVRDPKVLKLRERIAIVGSAALSKAKTTQAIAEIVSRDGRTLLLAAR